VFTNTFGNAGQVSVNEPVQPPTTIGSDLLAEIGVGVLESVTLNAVGKVLQVVGVPVMAPVVALSVSPFGRIPAKTDQWYGRMPPEAASGGGV
jgi:hypothetical protein